MTGPESKVKAAVKKLLATHGVAPIHDAADWYNRKKLPVIGCYFMPVSGGMGVHGIPDFVCTIAGRMVTIETKAAGKNPTALQESCMAGLRIGGGHTFVVRGNDLTELEAYLESTAKAWAGCRP